MNVIREGQLVALQRGSRRVYLRYADGVTLPGCEALVESIDSGNQFTLEDLPRELAETIKQMVMPTDGVCDGNGSADNGATS
jgi:hypothetical protein